MNRPPIQRPPSTIAAASSLPAVVLALLVLSACTVGRARADVPPQFLLKWGGYGPAIGHFNYPVGIAVDAAGDVLVTDGDNHRIQKFTSEGGFLAVWGSRGSGNGQFVYPVGIAAGPGGDVYVVDHFNNRVQRLSSTGAFVSKWGTQGSADGQFQYPEGVAADASGHVYVADDVNSRIQVFASDGTFLAKWGSPGSGDGQFQSPYGVAVDGGGHVYVADRENHRIQKFASDGTFLAKWGTFCGIANGSGCVDPDGPGPFEAGDGQLSYPTGVAVDGDGKVYVTDRSNHRIQKFTGSGVFLAKWGVYGYGDGEFDRPAAIATNPGGELYVLDEGNNRVEKFGPVPVPAASIPGLAILAPLLLALGAAFLIRSHPSRARA